MEVAVWDCRRCNHLEERVVGYAREWAKKCPKCGTPMNRGFVNKRDLPKGAECSTPKA